MRDSLSKTLNNDIHVALSKLGKEGMEDDNESEVLKAERSGSSTSGVYSSGGSVGSDSPDYNSSRKGEMAGIKAKKIPISYLYWISSTISGL